MPEWIGWVAPIVSVVGALIAVFGPGLLEKRKHRNTLEQQAIQATAASAQWRRDKKLERYSEVLRIYSQAVEALRQLGSEDTHPGERIRLELELDDLLDQGFKSAHTLFLLADAEVKMLVPRLFVTLEQTKNCLGTDAFDKSRAKFEIYGYMTRQYMSKELGAETVDSEEQHDLLSSDLRAEFNQELSGRGY